MKKLNTANIDSAIHALCPEIWENMNCKKKVKHSEEKLWKEMVCCILSSQVKFELSQSVTQNLDFHELLKIPGDYSFYEEQLREVLKSPVKVEGRYIKYRFPNAKAKQIAIARKNIYANDNSLMKILDEHVGSTSLRTTLVDLVPGLGMKQASMYLRNVSNSYELAVIDSHVLKYMNAVDLIKDIPTSISEKRYLDKENILSKYTKKFGYPVGCVDYAIWIVMRVASKDGYL